MNIIPNLPILHSKKTVGKFVFTQNYLQSLEMCPTSNIQTKAVEDFRKYPLYDFYKNGINVSINTDNRTVSNIDLSNEIKLISDKFNIDKDEYIDIYLNTVNATFADECTKEWLRRLI